jgi:hypothetical protein
MRFDKLMGPPAGVATAAPTIRSDIHKCQFNMTLGFVNGKNKKTGSGFESSRWSLTTLYA